MRIITQLGAAFLSLLIASYTHAAITSELTSNKGSPSSSTKKMGGSIGGRTFGGYLFNRYIGLEAGYANYDSTIYKGSVNSANSLQEETLQTVDLIGKAYLPLIATGFKLYALAGFAAINDPTMPPNAAPARDLKPADNFNKLSPVYGIGANLEATDKLSTGLEFSRIPGLSNMKTNSPSNAADADMMRLNFSYRFD